MDSKLFTVGFDEAGRGPLAGPVTAAAVILFDDFPLEILNDSKKLSEKKREQAALIIKEKALWGVASVSHTVIDQINILQASLLAMKNAYLELEKKLVTFLKENHIDDYRLCGITDGNFCPDVSFECRAEPKADATYSCVMAASILAKTTRDDYMIQMDKKYPQYGYAKHKGYPTAEHKKICHELGPSKIQRLSFKY